MGQIPPAKSFQPPMPFGASQASNVLSSSQPVAQAPQPAQPFINLFDNGQQGAPAQQPPQTQAQPALKTQQYQPPFMNRNQSYYGRSYYDL